MTLLSRGARCFGEQDANLAVHPRFHLHHAPFKCRRAQASFEPDMKMRPRLPVKPRSVMICKLTHEREQRVAQRRREQGVLAETCVEIV